ncbi:hypothetical protein JQS43_23180 [Natronosporangium hydrolyticum]|uniref:Serine hydrolase n=1 Tax=Natronosporangium hydrolyticum TaxID=2811111 RepID=A0A895YG31_9ACTN|nr:hypothetical protein [Natronosporangium hydrolyticum]QSB14363.1 hypothetical protein JQS43_23180 [Natronosporangium hydrolyticum]
MTPPPSPRPDPGRRWLPRVGSAERSEALDRLATAAAQRTTPRRAFTALVAVTALTAIALLLAAAPPSPDPQQKVTRALPGPEDSTVAPPPERPAPVPMAAAPARSPEDSGAPEQSTEFVSWALLDRRSGQITGSEPLTATSTTASMIKVWLVADHLRLAEEAGEPPDQVRLDQFSLIIRDSDNGYAQRLFQELGAHESIERMIRICGLTDSSAVRNLWSNTRLSARDTARMAECLADGRAAGSAWTSWLMDEMRAVRGIGDFGIRDALPPAQRAQVGIKNGWVIRDDENAWHVSCLAVTDEWAMGVLTRYPAELGHEHGAELCRALAEQHLPGSPPIG